MDIDESDEDEPAHQDPSPEYDAVEIYLKHVSTDFSSRPKKQTKEERDQWDLQRRVFAKSLAELQKQGVANVKLMLCTHQVAASDLIRKSFATVDCNGIVIMGDEDG